MRITEYRRSWPDGGGPVVEGHKVVEEIARGFSDMIAGNGHGSGYSTWRFENGDLMFGQFQNSIQTVVNPDTIADTSQRDQRLWRGALQQDARPQTLGLTGGIEPLPRPEIAAQQEQRRFGEFRDVNRSPSGQPVRAWHDRHRDRGEQRAIGEALVGRTGQCHVKLAAVEMLEQARATILRQMNVDAGVSVPEARDERRDESLQRLW
jgi:hypothetical protein